MSTLRLSASMLKRGNVFPMRMCARYSVSGEYQEIRPYGAIHIDNDKMNTCLIMMTTPKLHNMKQSSSAASSPSGLPSAPINRPMHFTIILSHLSIFKLAEVKEKLALRVSNNKQNAALIPFLFPPHFSVYPRSNPRSDPRSDLRTDPRSDPRSNQRSVSKSDLRSGI